MHLESYQEMSRLVTTYLRPDQQLRVLDVGSYDVNGTYRPLFGNEPWTYEGADLQAGPNVTHVLTDPYHWVLSDDSFDVSLPDRPSNISHSSGSPGKRWLEC